MPGQSNVISLEEPTRRAELQSKLKSLTSASARQELHIDYAADPLDQVRLSTDRELVVQQLDHKTRLIHGVESALEKLNEGTYGVCEECEETIPRRRLDAVPWARLCVACQSAAEVEGRGQSEFSYENAA